MFDTCTAGVPLSQTLFCLPAALKTVVKFCGVTFPQVWVIRTEVM